MSPPPLTSLSDTCLSGAIEKHKDRVTFTPEELGELKHLVETIAGPRVTAQTIVQTKAVAHPLCATKPRTSAAKKGLGHRRPSVSLCVTCSVSIYYSPFYFYSDCTNKASPEKDYKKTN